MNWTGFTRRTEDPKLAYLEHRLTAMGIPHRRNGDSFHAPILEVDSTRHDEAYALLSEPDAKHGRLDEVPDDDPRYAGHLAHDWPEDAGAQAEKT